MGKTRRKQQSKHMYNWDGDWIHGEELPPHPVANAPESTLRMNTTLKASDTRKFQIKGKVVGEVRTRWFYIRHDHVKALENTPLTEREAQLLALDLVCTSDDITKVYWVRQRGSEYDPRRV